MTGKMCAAAALLAGLWASAAQATLVVSTAATSNVSCSGGVCTATAANAVLNAHDLEVSLAHGDTTLASGSTAQDIEFDTPVHWASAQRLTLDSYHAIAFTQPVLSEGTGGMTITTNDGGTGGDFIFAGKGRVAFWNLSSSLIINGASYTLVGNIATLASDIKNNPSGRYAFANNYDASVDGTYMLTPIRTPFPGAFEGLGNTISHLTMQGSVGGLFAFLQPGSVARDLVLMGEVVESAASGAIGGFAGLNDGDITGVSVIGGEVTAKNVGPSEVGALVGDFPEGTITRSHASARVSCRAYCWVGGLVGQNQSSISQSSATGSVTGTNNSEVGGLVGRNQGGVADSFATGSVSTGDNVKIDAIRMAMAGGLVGSNEGIISQSYATGSASGGSGLRHANSYVWVGGLAGNSLVSRYSFGEIWQSYATGSASVGDHGYVGGIAGQGQLCPNIFAFTHFGIAQSYSTGAVLVTTGTSEIGGFLGDDNGNTVPNADTYWNLDTSGIADPSKGAGNKANDPGITGLTTTQLQSGLPAGFDPTIWSESAGINNGLPYLLALVPQ